jgi:hypothetical protein
MKRDILFSMTTVVERPDKREQLIKALHSIHKYEPKLQKYAKIVVVNEYSEAGVKANFLKEEFPWIDLIINKTKKDKGQAGSLNLIIKMLGTKNRPKFNFWLHFEESWIVTKPFLKICDEAMSIGIDQLQLTEDNWIEDHDYSITLPKTRKRIYVQSKHLPYKGYSDCNRSIHNVEYIEKHCRDDGQDEWPLWSLRPGIDRVSKILNVGLFSTAKEMWPVHFELDFALNYVLQPGGVTKAGIICTKRQKGHVSFSEVNYNKR